MSRLSILILASGSGSRMASEVPKVYLPVGGEAILLRTVRRLARLDPDAELVLATRAEDDTTHLAPLRAGLEALGVRRFVDGGATRQESMARALAATEAGRDLILVHDAARPFFPLEAARHAIARAAAVGAALLALPVPDTLKRVDDGGLVTGTLDRRGVHLAQTPQVVRRDLLERGLALGVPATDDVALVEALGSPVEAVPGSPYNIKITTPPDLQLAELLAAMEDFR